MSEAPLISNPPDKKTEKRITVRAAFIGVCLVFLLTIIEHMPSLPGTEQEGHHILSPAFWYDRVTRAPDHAKYVGVITVGRDMPANFPFESNGTEKKSAATKSAKAGPGSLEESCKRRLYISKLLEVLPRFKPKAVVLDIWFDPRLCEDQSVTATVFSALSNLSEKVPVVIGLPAYNLTDIQADMPAVFAQVSNRKPGLAPTELVLQPVTRRSNERMKEGLVERNIDARKIPLSWPVYDGFDQIGRNGQPHRLDTLSIAAVRAVDPHHSILRRIGALRDNGSPQASEGDHPYTGLIKENNLPIERAIDVMCSNPPDDWTNVCTGRSERHSVDPGIFAGKIVLIGFAGLGGDLHESPIGKVPGVILQANYVESLLDGRVFKLVPFWPQILLGLLWLFSAFLIARKSRSLELVVVAAIVLTYLISVLLRWSGYYTELTFGLAVGSITLLISLNMYIYIEDIFT